MQIHKNHLTVAAVLTLLFLGNAPVFAQAPAEETVYTYVADYRLKPGKGTDFWSEFEKTTQPILDQLVADGTLLEWGRSSSVLHTTEGMSEFLWYCAKTVGTTQKALEKIMASRSQAVVDSIEKHSDRLYQSVIFKIGSKRASTGYLETHTYVVKPGRGAEWLEGFKRYQQPVYEKLLDSGVILGYGIDREYLHTGHGGFRNIWVFLPDVDAIDKENAAFAADARSPEDRRMIQNAIADMTNSELHRDGLERVIKYVRK